MSRQFPQWSGRVSREELEAEENRRLAPYAVRSAESLGRRTPEEPHPYRTHFQRDRARIIHSSAFRRLDGKTQVFLNGTGDHFRTRLTHTMEVASVARTIARALALNEDLAETIALAHDLGHPPFGHSGEHQLDLLMRTHGGFDHNVQSLRVVEILEEKYPRFTGLNLSFEVLEGMRKHDTKLWKPDGSSFTHTNLEGQVADLADEITYHSHDLDDGLESGLLQPEQLEEVPLWREACALAKAERKRLHTVHDRGFIIRCLINREVDDLITASAARLRKNRVRTIEDVRQHRADLIGFSPGLKRENARLKKFLYQHLYHHPGVAGVHRRNCQLLEYAFHHYCKNPRLLGRKARRRLESQGLERTVCDYLAGMTDRYLHREIRRFPDFFLDSAGG
jgi:dGTPase